MNPQGDNSPTLLAAIKRENVRTLPRILAASMVPQRRPASFGRTALRQEFDDRKRSRAKGFQVLDSTNTEVRDKKWRLLHWSLARCRQDPGCYHGVGHRPSFGLTALRQNSPDRNVRELRGSKFKRQQTRRYATQIVDSGIAHWQDILAGP